MSFLSNLSIALLLVGGIGLTNAAYALDEGECGPPEQITEKLKAEGQRSIASAQRVMGDKRLFGVIFTANADRSIGYILQADKPLGDPATKICAYQRMANVRIFDARKAGVSQSAMLKAADADALRRCDQLAKEGKLERTACGGLNVVLRKIEAHGERVTMQGLLVQKSQDGTYRPDGTLATVTGRIGGSVNDFPDHPALGIAGSILFSSLPDGATIINVMLAYVEYTPYGLAAFTGEGPR